MNVIFHLGLHKTATTWLQQVYFHAHPHVKLINDSARPWDDMLIRYLVVHDDDSFIPQTFRQIVSERIASIEQDGESSKMTYLISAERLSGHPASGGYDRSQIARNIQRAFPESRKFVLVRDHIAIIESTYRQLVKEGYCGTLEEMCTQKCWKLPCFQLAYFDYTKLERVYRSIFDAGTFELFHYEELKQEKNFFLKELCSFLGVPYMADDASPRRNVAYSDNKIRAIRLLNHYRKSDYNPYPVFNVKSRLLYRVILDLLTFLCSRKPIGLSQELRKSVLEYYIARMHGSCMIDMERANEM